AFAVIVDLIRDEAMPIDLALDFARLCQVDAGVGESRLFERIYREPFELANRLDRPDARLVQRRRVLAQPDKLVLAKDIDDGAFDVIAGDVHFLRRGPGERHFRRREDRSDHVFHEARLGTERRWRLNGGLERRGRVAIRPDLLLALDAGNPLRRVDVILHE